MLRHFLVKILILLLLGAIVWVFLLLEQMLVVDWNYRAYEAIVVRYSFIDASNSLINSIHAVVNAFNQVVSLLNTVMLFFVRKVVT